jgi:hypothetical protein
MRPTLASILAGCAAIATAHAAAIAHAQSPAATQPPPPATTQPAAPPAAATPTLPAASPPAASPPPGGPPAASPLPGGPPAASPPPGGPAAAAPAAPGTSAPPAPYTVVYLAPPPPPPPNTSYLHDGFYLRMALGLGGLTASREVQSSITGTVDTHFGEGVGVFEISAGGTPGPGLVLAGTLLSHERKDPVLKGGPGGDITLDGRLSFGMVGVTVDYYPNPRGGFHFGGTLGVGGLTAPAPPRSVFTDKIGGGGGAISLALGYDWWIGQEWSFGVLGRFTGAAVKGETTAADVKYTETDSIGAFGLMASFLYH